MLMKILNVMLTRGKGGLEQVFLDYNFAFRRNGISAVSVVHKKSPLILDQEDHFYKIANFSKYDPFALLSLWQIVRKEKPDIILTHGNRAHYLMHKIAGRIPLVGISHVYSFSHITKCDYIITVNKDMINNLASLGYNKSRIFHIPNMLKARPGIKYKKPSSLRSTPTLGLLARLDPIKGIDIFIQAIASLKSRNIEINAIIGGDGPEYNNIKNLISHFKLEDNIKMIGWVENKEAFYNEIDILCMPSLKETFGLVILESFLYSKPVIISILPGPMEIVRHNENGLVFNTGNPDDLAEKIELLAFNQNLQENLSKQAFEDLKEYSEAKISDKIASSFEEIWKQAGGKTP